MEEGSMFHGSSRFSPVFSTARATFLQNAMAFSSSQVDENEVIGNTNSRPNIFHRKYSTTSSLYVNATLACPASRQQLLSIACIIQSQITTSVCTPESEKILPSPNFELSPSEDMALTFEYEKVEEFEFDMGRAISEAMDRTDEVAKNVAAGNVPPLMEIYSFLNHLFVDYSPSCNIIALIYADRMLEVHGPQFTKSSWKLIWISLVALTQKIWDDKSTRSTEFLKLIPSVNKQKLRQLEMSVLYMIRYCIIVSPSLYAEYYFELRKVYTEITGMTQNNDDTVQQRLSTASALKIKAVSKSLKAKLTLSKRGNKKKGKCSKVGSTSPLSVESTSSRSTLSTSSVASQASRLSSTSVMPNEIGNVFAGSSFCSSISGTGFSENSSTPMSLTDRLLLNDLKRSERKVSRYADEDNDSSDCEDMNSIISNSSLLMTPGEPHGREEHQQQKLSPTLEQGCNTYEDITRNVNIGTLVLS